MHMYGVVLSLSVICTLLNGIQSGEIQPNHYIHLTNEEMNSLLGSLTLMLLHKVNQGNTPSPPLLDLSALSEKGALSAKILQKMGVLPGNILLMRSHWSCKPLEHRLAPKC